MDVIKFKLSDYEWYRVITIINGKKLNKFLFKDELKADVYEKVYDGDSYGDGVYPGWLYYELNGGHYWTCPGKISTAFEPYIPYYSGTSLSHYESGTGSMITKWCEGCKKRGEMCKDKAAPECAAVLGCACGDDGCNVYLVRITKTENTVIWDDYFAFYHNTPNYFHFEFEKKQYFEEVEKLIDLTLKIGKFEGLPLEIVNDIKNNHKVIEKENNSYIKYPQTLYDLIEQMDSFSDRITGDMFDLACYGKRKKWKGAKDYADEDELRNTGDKNIDLTWEVLDKIQEVIKKIKD